MSNKGFDKNQVKLKQVSKKDYRFLYKLLTERGPFVSISHKNVPPYKQHVKFVTSKPYSSWYIISYENKKIGSIYLSKQNEIGISIVKRYDNFFLKQISLEILFKKNPRKRYIANCNPKNSSLIKFYKKNGFKLIQYSYELIF